ncbi:tetratricopeptide repeat protein [Haliangium ochraceum]|nr:tetratricopeptide repeat protein [Haliangium ochraceum]
MSNASAQTSITPSDVLRHMQVDGYNRTYVLGSYERRVTVYSQQVRALNLIYSLFHERQLAAGQRVAVIGGGVAGLTAAAGALRKGCEVTVLEKNERLLHMFERCTKRWLHPRVYDWPLPDSLDPDAALPVLTWQAAPAGEVVERIREQWEAIKTKSGDRARVESNISNADIDTSNAPPLVTWNPYEIGEFNVVVVAVGFGIEKRFPAATWTSYWDDDALDGSDRGDGEVSILVSGLGDGSLTDLVRASLEGYRHDELVTHFGLDPEKNPAARKLADHLLELEDEAVRRERSDGPEAAARYLTQEYGKPLDELAKFVDDQLKVRDRRKVILNGEGQFAITRSASILNRLLAARLLSRGRVHYRSGKLTVPEDKAAGTVIIGDGDPESFHKIIARHGTESAMDKGFRTLHKDAETRFRARNELDQTRRERMWEREDDWYGAAPTSPVGGAGRDTPSPQLTARPEAHAGASYSPSNHTFEIPFLPRRDRLLGRDEALAQVREQLVNGCPTAIGQAAAFQGLGGLGKTQLAVDYAYRHRDDYPSGVIWLEADRDLDAQLVELSTSARWIAPSSEHEHKLAIALQRLRTFAGGLIIFDNVEASADIEDYLPRPDVGAHILITSRGEHAGFRPIGLSLLEPEQAVALLEQVSERVATNAAERNEARRIGECLDGLPLAIELAGNYLRRRPSVSWRAYRELLDASLREAIPAGRQNDTLTRHEANLFATLRVSEHLLDESPRLRRILDVLTWSGTASMGTPLLAALLGEEPVLLAGDLGYGVALGLLHLDEARDTEAQPSAPRHRLHRLVREVRRHEPIGLKDPKHGHAWARQVCGKLGDWFEQRRQDFADLATFEAELDHLRTWRDTTIDHGWPEGVRLTWLLSYPAFHHGRYREAKERVQDALTRYERLGLDEPTLAAHLHNDLGTTCNTLGDHQTGLKHFQQALKIRRRVLGELHPDTAFSLANLGSAYGALDDHQTGLKHSQQALEIRRRVLGELHPDTAFSLANLGTLYGALGDHQTGLKHSQQALEIQQGVLGEQHPHAAASLNNVGTAYRALGQHQTALQHQQEALEIRRRVLGELHPDTASSLNVIGETYRALGKHQTALQHHQEALEIRRRVLGELHPHTATSLNNIGGAYYDLAEHRRALAYFEQAWPIFCQVFGDHDDRSLNALLGIADCMGRARQQHRACELLNRTLRTLPTQHPRRAALRQLRQRLNPPGFRPLGASGPNRPKTKRADRPRHKRDKSKRR